MEQTQIQELKDTIFQLISKFNTLLPQQDSIPAPNPNPTPIPSTTPIKFSRPKPQLPPTPKPSPSLQTKSKSQGIYVNKYSLTCTINGQHNYTCIFTEHDTIMNTYIFPNFKEDEFEESTIKYLFKPKLNFIYNNIKVESITDISIDHYFGDDLPDNREELAREILNLDSYNWFYVTAIQDNRTINQVLPFCKEDLININGQFNKNKYKRSVDHDTCNNCTLCTKGWKIKNISNLTQSIENLDKSPPIEAFTSLIYKSRVTESVILDVYKKYFDTIRDVKNDCHVTIKLPFLDDVEYKPKLLKVNTMRIVAGKIFERKKEVISVSDTVVEKQTNIKIDTLSFNMDVHDGHMMVYIQVNGCDDFIVSLNVDYKNLLDVEFDGFKITNMVVLHGYTGPGLNVRLWEILYNEIYERTGGFNLYPCRDRTWRADRSKVEEMLMDEKTGKSLGNTRNVEEIRNDNYENNERNKVYLKCTSAGLFLKKHRTDIIEIVVDEDKFHGWKNGIKYRCHCFGDDCLYCKMGYLNLLEIKHEYCGEERMVELL